MRDDFTKTNKDLMAKRVGFKCSNPNCRKVTIGPSIDEEKTVNVGVAAHVKAAAVGGKRYDPNQSSKERSSIENGIWLCQTCAKLIDSDEQKYSCDLLVEWKSLSENEAALDVENPPQSNSENIFITAINPVQSQVAHTIVNLKPSQRTILPIKARLIERLKLSPQEYQLHLSSGDSEIEILAKEIDQAFKEAGWENTGFIYNLASFYPPGITIEVNEVNEINQFIADIFHSLRLTVTANKTHDSKEFRLYIGPNN
ncbi:hypothetical protein COB64_02375 [Candidatus Wolfebacteria bacterium]|nr:MAG: hypothetical protein COB64_02375 [Candidatus Wolfebacteria bacterium]